MAVPPAIDGPNAGYGHQRVVVISGGLVNSAVAYPAIGVRRLDWFVQLLVLRSEVVVTVAGGPGDT